MAVAIVGLKKATEIALQEGLEDRYRRHSEVAAYARTQFGGLQLQLFPDERCASDTVCALRADPKWESRLRSELISRFNIMIAGGLGVLQGKILRIGHMGTSATKTAISTTRVAMEAILGDLRN